MPLDHDAQTLLEMVRAANRPAFETVGAAEARLLYMAGRKVLAPEPLPVAETRDLTMPGPGGPISLRLYRSSSWGVSHERSSTRSSRPPTRPTGTS